MHSKYKPGGQIVSLSEIQPPHKGHRNESSEMLEIIQLVSLISENDGPYRRLLIRYLFSLTEKELGLVNGAMQAGRDIIWCGPDPQICYKDLKRVTDEYDSWCIPGAKSRLVEYIASKAPLSDYLDAYLRQA